MSVQDDIIQMNSPGEVVTAVVHQRQDDNNCEAYVGPLVIGYYPTESTIDCEVWIQCEGKRVQIPHRYLKAVIRLLKIANAGGQA